MGKGYSLEREVEVELCDAVDQCLNLPFLDRTFRTGMAQQAQGSLLKGDVWTQIPFIKKQLLIECKDYTTMNRTADHDSVFHLYEEWVTLNEERSKVVNRISVLAFPWKLKPPVKAPARHWLNRVQFVMSKKDFTYLTGVDPVASVPTAWKDKKVHYWLLRRSSLIEVADLNPSKLIPRAYELDSSNYEIELIIVPLVEFVKFLQLEFVLEHNRTEDKTSEKEFGT